MTSQQCSKLTSVRRSMAANFSSGPTICEDITLESALMTDKILGIKMKIEMVSPAGLQPQKLVSNTAQVSLVISL